MTSKYFDIGKLKMKRPSCNLHMLIVFYKNRSGIRQESTLKIIIWIFGQFANINPIKLKIE